MSVRASCSVSAGGTGKYPSFGRSLWPRLGPSTSPAFQFAFTGIDFVEAVVRALVIAHVVEDEVLELGAEIGRVADARAFQIGFGLLRDVAGVAAVSSDR